MEGTHHCIYGGYLGWGREMVLLFGIFSSVLKEAHFCKFNTDLLIVFKMRMRNEVIFQHDLNKYMRFQICKHFFSSVRDRHHLTPKRSQLLLLVLQVLKRQPALTHLTISLQSRRKVDST